MGDTVSHPDGVKNCAGKGKGVTTELTFNRRNRSSKTLKKTPNKQKTKSAFIFLEKRPLVVMNVITCLHIEFRLMTPSLQETSLVAQ